MSDAVGSRVGAVAPYALPVLGGAAVGGTTVGLLLHKVDVTARADAKAVSRASMATTVGRQALIYGTIMAGSTVIATAKDGEPPNPMAMGVLAVGGLGLGAEAVHKGYSLLVAPSGTFNPGDIAGNLEARYARADGKPGAIASRLIKLLKH